jgi:1-acyl-sn-glycerol-3-phosphate acyltransferase
MFKQVKHLQAGFWLGFFLISIAVLGGFFAYLISVPLLLISKTGVISRNPGERALAYGVHVLLKVQPWLNADVQLPRGRDQLPGTLYLSNHRSHLDAFFLLAAIPGIRILARSSLFRVPGLGFMMKQLQQISVHRGDAAGYLRAMEQIRDRIHRGESVHVFPEMTRCPAGLDGVQAFSLLPFKMAHDAGCRVVPLVFKRTDAVWPKGYSGLVYGETIQVRTLPALDVRRFTTAAELRTEVVGRIESELRA